MIRVRQGVFETNSSSTHSITMCMKSEYELWQKGCLFCDEWGEGLISKEDALKRLQEYGRIKSPDEISEEELFEKLRYEGIFTFEDYKSSDYLEHYKETFTTPSGETVIAFGRYGYDG